MYKFKSKQISFSDFGQPVGMETNPDNRWIKKAAVIPWEQIELKYAKLFANRRGNVAKPLHLALEALISYISNRMLNQCSTRIPTDTDRASQPLMQ